MIRAIIIDDEKICISALALLIETNLPEIQIIASCPSADEGIEAIFKYNPDLLFLDIEMPVMNGFEVLEKISHIPVQVIFTTAHHHHAIKAIRYSALDYLLKPIEVKELIHAVQRFKNTHTIHTINQLQFLIDKLANKENTYNKIAIPNLEGLRLISVNEILYCQADDNYTHIHLINNQHLLASRTLKDIQILLEEFDFFLRIHNSYLVNVHKVIQYLKGEGGIVIMSDGKNLPVSRNKKEALLIFLSRGKHG
jgi:two-component system, LytTR family, response regulator